MTDPHHDLELIDLEGGDAPQGARPPSGTPDVVETGTSWWRRGAVLIVLAVVALLAWGGLAWWRLDGVRDDLLVARGQLEEVRTAVDDRELGEAAALLEEARVTFASAVDRLEGPVVLPVRLLPGVSDDLRAVTDLSTAGESVAEAGSEVAGALDLGGDGPGALAPSGGRIPIDVVRGLGETLDEAGDAMSTALDLAAGIPRSGIDPQIAAARNEFVELVEPLGEQLSTAARLSELVPPLFGAAEPRRYLVVASNPTESRGSGGFIGAFTTMEADDGALSFGEVTITEDLPRLSEADLPWPDPSLEERYGPYGGPGLFPNLNMTPDFPSAATLIENYYAEAFDEPVDGVIAVDPFAFESLLTLSGPVELSGYGTLAADDVVEFVTHEAYRTITDADERKRLIGEVAAAALQGFLDSPDEASLAEVMRVLGEMTSRESILIHATDAEEQERLEELGVAGRLGDGAEGDVVGVFLNSGVPYKVEYWLERQLRYETTLGPDGTTASILSAGFVNGAPTTGEPSYMIGFGPEYSDFEFGEALSLVSAYCSVDCRVGEKPDDGFQELPTEVGRELGFGVSSTWMRLLPGQSRELAWSMTGRGWVDDGPDRVYRLHYDHQTTIRPTQLDVVVNVPEGFEPTTVPDGAAVDEATVRLTLEPIHDIDLTVVFSPIEP